MDCVGGVTIVVLLDLRWLGGEVKEVNLAMVCGRSEVDGRWDGLGRASCLGRALSFGISLTSS